MSDSKFVVPIQGFDGLGGSWVQARLGRRGPRVSGIAKCGRSCPRQMLQAGVRDSPVRCTCFGDAAMGCQELSSRADRRVRRCRHRMSGMGERRRPSPREMPPPGVRNGRAPPGHRRASGDAATGCQEWASAVGGVVGRCCHRVSGMDERRRRSRREMLPPPVSNGGAPSAGSSGDAATGCQEWGSAIGRVVGRCCHRVSAMAKPDETEDNDLRRSASVATAACTSRCRRCPPAPATPGPAGAAIRRIPHSAGPPSQARDEPPELLPMNVSTRSGVPGKCARSSAHFGGTVLLTVEAST